MTRQEIVIQRLANLQIVNRKDASVESVVAALGALQAQDYLGALWSIALRVPGATEASVEQAVFERKIVRSWPMRGTLHFVAAADLRWMLELLTPRIIAGSAGRCRELELDETIFQRSRKLFEKVLQGGQQITRDGLMELLEGSGISTKGQRGYHILWRLAQEGLLCFGPRVGKQQTFVLLEEWLPSFPHLTRPKALAELARRYFTSHGPVTFDDYVGWTGLKVAEAKEGWEAVASEFVNVRVDGEDYWMAKERLKSVVPEAYLLPGFDEYLLGYKNRSLMVEPQYMDRIVPGGNGMFISTLVIKGQVIGSWRREVKKKAVDITINPFRVLKRSESVALTEAAERYGQFHGLPGKLEFVVDKASC